MNGTRKLALGAAAMALTVGGAFAASSASAEPKAAPAAAALATTTTWGKFTAAGGVLGGQGFSRVSHFGTGRYNITTTSSLVGCALLGTINTNGGDDPGPGSSSILVGLLNPTTLFVRTATPSGTGNATVDSDRPFSITAIC